MARVQAVRFVFTINNFTQEEEELVMNLPNITGIKYCIAEEEHLEEGTPHIQGYIHFERKRDRKSVERLLGGRAFVEIARGSEKENIDYCSKENQVIVQVGEPVASAKLAILKEKDEEAIELIKDMRELKEEDFEAKHPYYYKNHVQQVREFRHEYLVRTLTTYDGNLKGKNLWIWGAPGVGKSRIARSGKELWRIYNKPWNKWWNGFNQDITERVVIDDWPCAPMGDALVQLLKIWGDRYPFTAEIKGAHICISPTFQIIVTSNYAIDDCFSKSEDRDAIKRRFTEWLMLGGETLDEMLTL